MDLDIDHQRLLVSQERQAHFMCVLMEDYIITCEEVLPTKYNLNLIKPL